MRKLANDIIIQISRTILLSTHEELAKDFNGKDIEIFRKCADRIEEAKTKLMEKKNDS